MKYIRHKTMGFYTFPRSISHKDFAIMNCMVVKEDIVSAGFVANGQCRDRSVSLGITAGENDTADLMEQMGMEALK